MSGLTVPTGITLSTTPHFSHNKGTVIYRSNFDYFSVEGQSSSSTPFNNLTLIPIQWDKFQTIYEHLAGTDTWNYRFRLYNSILNQYSAYSPTLSGGGFARNQAGQMVLNVRDKIRDPNRVRYSDKKILNLLQDAQMNVITLIPKLWFLYVDTWETAITTGNGTLTSNGLGIPSSANTTKYTLSGFTDINYIDKIRYYYATNGSFNLWDLHPLAAIDFDRYLFNQNRIKSDVVLSFKLLPPDVNSAQGYFEVDPMNLTANTGLFYPVYWRNPTAITSVASIIDFPYPEVLEDYAAWKLHDNMGNQDEAKKYKSYYFGPSSQLPNQEVTGIKMLQEYNNEKGKVLGYGKKLWNYRGRRGTGNFFGKGLVNRDFIKENYM